MLDSHPTMLGLTCSVLNEQVNPSICGITFGGGSPYAMLFNTSKIFLFWKALGWLRVICILTKACSFASWKILTQITFF